MNAHKEMETVKRFIVDEVGNKENTAVITGPEARHIARVLRMRPGDRFILMDRKGARFQALITYASSREVRVALEMPIPAPPSPPVEIHVLQALLKPRSMDYMIQKTSELGVAGIHPFYSERSVVRLDREAGALRLRHWREIAGYATTQSDRDLPAGVDESSVSTEAAAQWAGKDALKVILWEGERANDLRSALRRVLPAKVFVGVVGPEGGFSEKEVDAFRKAGFQSVSMGRRVLRAETAAIALVTLVQYEWGDLSLTAS